MEKMEKWLNLWIQPIKPMKKVWQAALLRLKAKKVYHHVTWGQKNVKKPFSASAGWVARFKRPYGVNNVKLAAEASAANQEAAEGFK